MKVREEKLPEKMLVKNHYVQQHPILNFSYAEGKWLKDMFKPDPDEEADEPDVDSDTEEDPDLDDDYKAFLKKEREDAEKKKNERERKREKKREDKEKKRSEGWRGQWAQRKERKKHHMKTNKRLLSKKGASYIRAKYDFKRQIEEDWTENMQKRFIRMQAATTYNILLHTYNIPRKIFEMWFRPENKLDGPESKLDKTVQCEIIKIIKALYGGTFSKHMLVEACDVYIRKDDEDDEDDEDGNPFGDPVEPNTEQDPIARLRLKLKRWVIYPAKMKRVAANKKIAEMKKRAGGIGFGSINQFRKFF